MQVVLPALHALLADDRRAAWSTRWLGARAEPFRASGRDPRSDLVGIEGRIFVGVAAAVQPAPDRLRTERCFRSSRRRPAGQAAARRSVLAVRSRGGRSGRRRPDSTSSQPGVPRRASSGSACRCPGSVSSAETQVTLPVAESKVMVKNGSVKLAGEHACRRLGREKPERHPASSQRIMSASPMPDAPLTITVCRNHVGAKVRGQCGGRIATAGGAMPCRANGRLTAIRRTAQSNPARHSTAPIVAETTAMQRFAALPSRLSPPLPVWPRPAARPRGILVRSRGPQPAKIRTSCPRSRSASGTRRSWSTISPTLRISELRDPRAPLPALSRGPADRAALLRRDGRAVGRAPSHRSGT